jgi:hypothetical protein
LPWIFSSPSVAASTLVAAFSNAVISVMNSRSVSSFASRLKPLVFSALDRL